LYVVKVQDPGVSQNVSLSPCSKYCSGKMQVQDFAMKIVPNNFVFKQLKQK
jgi:hypothetical protein